METLDAILDANLVRIPTPYPSLMGNANTAAMGLWTRVRHAMMETLTILMVVQVLVKLKENQNAIRIKQDLQFVSLILAETEELMKARLVTILIEITGLQKLRFSCAAIFAF